MSQAVLPHMIERGSRRIVNISSIIGETTNIGRCNCAASKSGRFGLTNSLTREAAFHLAGAGQVEEAGIGITVNTVAPGYIATEMVDAAPERTLERIGAPISLGRLGRSDETAQVAHFVVADQCLYITGAVWPANGGMDV